MTSYSNEFKVGLLGIFAAAALALFILRTDDRPDGALEGYTLEAHFPSASGLFVSSQVQIAGVSVGSVRAIRRDGEQALVTLEMSGEVKLPVDSVAELQIEGILGDKNIRVVPGSAGELLGDGDELQTRTSGPDIDKLTGQVEQIASDIEAITGKLRGYLEDEETAGAVTGALKNIEALSEDMRQLSASNRAEVDAIARNLREVSESLNRIIGQLGGEAEGNAETFAEVMDKLDGTMEHVRSIAAKVDRGDGTLGALVNEDEPVRQLGEAMDEINASLQEVSDLVGSVSRLGTEVQYHGQYFFGSDPGDGSPYDNPVAGGSRNRIGLRLMPREDFWYLVEVVDYPAGVFSYEEVSRPDLSSAYSTYVRTLDLRYSFQFARRFRNTALRLGLYESSGGVGVDQYLLRDRLVLSANLYDFTYGSWPWFDGTPNLSLGLRAEPLRHLYVEGGLHNAVLGWRHGFYTGYAGAGFYFSDDDIKWLFSVLPVP